MRQINAIAIPTTEKVEEYNSTSFSYEAVGDVAKCYARCADAVDEQDFSSIFWAPFIDPRCTVLVSRVRNQRLSRKIAGSALHSEYQMTYRTRHISPTREYIRWVG